jgi:general secretion pathway protein A
MYKRFFDLRERPFKLVPNPAYLFLSRSHEEALAHLTYAVSEGDGFVAIIGEVGTGKTTLCRTFLESLDERVEAAFVFNPKLDAIQLLKTINDEFGIDSRPDNTKDLIDNLNRFLIEKKAQGRSVILVIDEAQNLSKEVLEQLRLLSNLETTVDKLLQIVLVGQPELGETLDSYDMRQLGQRITLSCWLAPLNFKETRGYIHHRINVASTKNGIKFDHGACRAIHRYSGGIPRLINIACDRALLTAYSLNRCRITPAIAHAAIRELAGMGEVKGRQVSAMALGVMGVLAVAAVAMAAFLYTGPLASHVAIVAPTGSDAEAPEHVAPVSVAMESMPAISEDTAAAASVTEAAAVADENVAPPDPVAVSRRELQALLASTSPRASRHAALKAILARWGVGTAVTGSLETVDDDATFFNRGAESNGLAMRRVDADLGLIRRLNLPAILELHLPESLLPFYLTVANLGDDTITLHAGGVAGEDRVIVLAPAALSWFWSGVAYVPWRDFRGIDGTIPLSGTDGALLALKGLLREIGFDDIDGTATYDDHTRERIKEIQAQYGLEVDGLVGSLTKIALYDEDAGLDIPHITGRGRERGR